MGTLYKEYGLHIIWKYPRHFATRVLWPNTKKYFAPPIEVLETYNAGKKTVAGEAQAWFGYTKAKIKTRMYEPNISVLNFHPVISGIMNLVMLFGLLYYLLLKGWQQNSAFCKTLIIGTALWLLGAVFTISISSVALRLQSFPMILTSIFALLLVDWMVKLMRQIKLEQSKHIKDKANFSNEVIA
jgi:hypothetical protein